MINPFRYLFRPPKMRSFRYKYQRHPFDEWQYFAVNALTQTDADVKAKDRFQQLFKHQQTVMTEFFRA